MDKVLIGMILGALLQGAREWWFKRQSIVLDRQYLAVLAVFALEKLGSECAEIVFDDGLSQGQKDKNGCRTAQTSPPTFTPNDLDVEWKAIPVGLMYKIFNLINEINDSNHHISATIEHEAGPPDYEEFFEERQLSYAQIGVRAFMVADELRKLGALPKRELRNWDPVESMKSAAERVREEKELRQEQQSKSMEKLGF